MSSFAYPNIMTRCMLRCIAPWKHEQLGVAMIGHINVIPPRVSYACQIVRQRFSFELGKSCWSSIGLGAGYIGGTSLCCRIDRNRLVKLQAHMCCSLRRINLQLTAPMTAPIPVGISTVACETSYMVWGSRPPPKSVLKMMEL